MSATSIQKNSVYITLQYLRTVEGKNKYHWGIFNSGSTPPKGHLVHATDAGRRALDLYQEVRPVSNPLKSGSMVVVLKIAQSLSIEALDQCARSVRLMDPKYLPRGERQWTCRVWVKEVLGVLHQNKYISLPADLNTIERFCEYTADANIQYMGRAIVFNDLSWMSTQPPSRNTLSQNDALDPRRGGRSAYGSSPMDIDSTGRRAGSSAYGSSPMDIDSTGRRVGRSTHGSSPMDIDSTGRRSGRSTHGSSAMVIDSSHGRQYR
ncbi:hypothetical protein QBC42DRAFT_259892 [Cladorrhinum samala]|uniref:Uncharacterized protein n=1 Tax=Cladorrhinum samala TaxID=585594 RepID=A0AAV9I2S1_9PEZI|nr:hypothetical protein QBC42DRAFT_259892 [Cladorrhinum samala]